MRYRMGYYILYTSPSLGLRRGRRPLLNQACSRGWFSSSVLSSLFVSIFVSTLYMFGSRHIGLYFLFPFLIIIVLAFFHALGYRLSDKHLVYSLASVFENVSSPAFNVSMFIWSLPAAVPFFLSRSAASISHDVTCGTSFGSVWIMALCSLSYSSV